jgi:hypothetical protein
MVVKRFALIGSLFIATLLPAAAPAAGCSPLSCAPSGTRLDGDLLLVRPSGIGGPVQIVDLRTGTVARNLPAGVLAARRALIEQSSLRTLTWRDATTGEVTGKATIAAAGEFRLVGASQDGKRAVLQRGEKGDSTFAVVSPSGEQVVNVHTDVGWGFDALAGDKLYLLRYLHSGYEIVIYDLAADKLSAKPIKDPKASSTIWGIPWVRTESADGRYLFTLYIGGNGGAMVHQLDLKTSAARCIDLQGTGDFNSATTWALELSPNGKTLWAVNPGYGRVAGIDVGSRKVRVAFRFKATSLYENGPVASVSAMSPDGKRMAVAAAGKLLNISLPRRSVTEGKPMAAVALGYAPDGTTLWVVGKGSRVTAVPAL